MNANTRLMYTDVRGLDIPDEDINHISSFIPAYFAERVRSSGKREQKIQKLAAGLLLSYALKRRRFMPAEAVIITKSQGKPVFKSPEGLHFNISHSAGLVLLAVSRSEVGCDIQKISGSGEKIAGRFFTASENEVLKNAGANTRDVLFTRMWARKESYIKATGEGMKRDLRSFSVLDDETEDGFYFADYDLDGYAAAACFCREEAYVKNSSSRPELRFHTFQSLTDVI